MNQQLSERTPRLDMYPTPPAQVHRHQANHTLLLIYIPRYHPGRADPSQQQSQQPLLYDHRSCVRYPDGGDEDSTFPSLFTTPCFASNSFLKIL
ncbi:hypothetical protein PILCRDRAFT_822841 [Piloderma croceum F 1598]|uniref:Uncharacterized protein n=1 Tax=Piloderma croceum (strain F 1598) TaxID=765440 RepID=A0A0C3FJJ8_PILCF|nr:hypothetical protein PILCRDRAFT_822841 [Piloderma croceum F 1598]